MSVTIEVLANEWNATGDSMIEAAAALPEEAKARLPAAAEAIKTSGIDIIRNVTPKASGKLSDSTDADIFYDGLGAKISYKQPAVSEPNRDGSGGGFVYQQAVRLGRVAVYPVTKKALASADGSFGPVAYSRATSGNDYIPGAMDTLQPEADSILAEYGLSTFRAVVEVIRA